MLDLIAEFTSPDIGGSYVRSYSITNTDFSKYSALWLVGTSAGNASSSWSSGQADGFDTYVSWTFEHYGTNLSGSGYGFNASQFWVTRGSSNTVDNLRGSFTEQWIFLPGNNGVDKQMVGYNVGWRDSQAYYYDADVNVNVFRQRAPIRGFSFTTSYGQLGTLKVYGLRK